MTFVLASASPRRLDLLAQVGLVPDRVLPAEIDEAPRRAELPAAYAARMAREKCVQVSRKCSAQRVLAADTVVAAGGASWASRPMRRRRAVPEPAVRAGGIA